jgi:hypothetical protein
LCKLAKVINERLLALTLHNNVINVRLGVAPNLGAKAFPHGSLEGGSCILEPKGHASIEVAPYWGDERCLLFILYCHLNLVVNKECIEGSQQVTACHGIHDLVDVRQQEWILGICLVDIVKSMHIHIAPLDFGTTTGFASHVVCTTSWITLAFSNFRTSLMMKSCRSCT